MILYCRRIKFPALGLEQLLTCLNSCRKLIAAIPFNSLLEPQKESRKKLKKLSPPPDLEKGVKQAKRENVVLFIAQGHSIGRKPNNI